MFITQLAGAYEVGRFEEGPGSSTALDLYAGARYWYMDADLSLKITGQVDLARISA